MNRRQCGLIIVLVMFGSLIGGIVSSKVAADMSIKVASREYRPSFSEWVFVYLNSKYSRSTDNYFVDVTMKIINKKIRFVINGYYVNNKIGQQWYLMVGSNIEKDIANQCKIWKHKGYRISLNDFEMNISSFY